MDSNHRYPEREACFFPRSELARRNRLAAGTGCRRQQWRRANPSGAGIHSSLDPLQADKKGVRNGEYVKRDRGFESISLQRGVNCEPDFRARIPSVTCAEFLHAIDVEAGGRR